MSGLKVLAVASEIYPLIKTGGLADVVGALPAALGHEGIEVVSLVPGYPALIAGLAGGEVVLDLGELFGGVARLIAAQINGVALLVLDAPHRYDRPGNPYLAADGSDWGDNAFRFAALAAVAARIAFGDLPRFVPDVVHLHDWQAGLAAAYLAYDGRQRPAMVATIHNLAFQGRFPRELLGSLGLPERAFAIEGVECYGAIGFLKAALQFADRITTVSATYAQEIQTAEHGHGLDGLLRVRADVLSGIVNGIDTDVWNPATDDKLASRYDLTSLSARAPNKSALQRRFGLDCDPQRPLFGVIGRMTWQKGIDVLADAAPILYQGGAQLVMLGTGEAALEQRLSRLVDISSGSFACIFGYDEDLAHLMQGGVDALIVSSRFEPCGLTQLCALRYGAVPVVARVGGLAETVVDVTDTTDRSGTATGVQFYPVTGPALDLALRRTLALRADPERWARLQANGMAADVSWAKSARAYAALFRDLLTTRN